MKYNFDTLDEVEEYFKNKGFKTIAIPDYLDYERVPLMMQKRYDDEIGKRYFINLKVYDFTFTNKVEENYQIEFECQHYQKDTHNAVNMQFLDWSLEEIEEWVDRLFTRNLLDYYELWD